MWSLCCGREGARCLCGVFDGLTKADKLEDGQGVGRFEGAMGDLKINEKC
jgi:hypothetical protein